MQTTKISSFSTSELGSLNENKIYLGGTDWKVEGVWKWLGEDEPYFTKTDGCLQSDCFWRSGQPDGGYGGEWREYALEFEKWDGKWNDMRGATRPSVYVK